MGDPLNPETWIFLLLRGVGAGRHPRGFPDPGGWILSQYGTKRSHGDLIQTIFHDFCPKSHIFYVNKTQARPVQARPVQARPVQARLVQARPVQARPCPGQACPGQALSRPGLVQARPVSVDQTHCLFVETTQSPLRAGGAGRTHLCVN